MSAPAIEIGEEYLSNQMQSLDRWLKNIFEQDKNDAFRRPRSFRIRGYEKGFFSVADITKQDVRSWAKLRMKEKLGMSQRD